MPPLNLNNAQKKHLAIAGGVLVGIVIIATLFSLLYHPSTPNSSNNGGIETLPDMNAPTQDYFRGSTQVTTSKEEGELRKKMEERGKAQELRLGFTDRGFSETTPATIVLRSATMTQFELDTSNTGLSAGTKLNISIPAAGLHSQIMIPGRYGFLLTFNKTGEQEIILEGDGLKGGKIVKMVTVQ